MKNYLFLAFVSCFTFLLLSCEDLIDLKINDADPRYVIEADLHNLSKVQVIKISQTVALNESKTSRQVGNAQVEVMDSKGRTSLFSYRDNGEYYIHNFDPIVGEEYKLTVVIGDQLFEAHSTMPQYVEIDTAGFVKEEIFSKDYYFLAMRFNDPIDEANYYKYNMSVNDGPYEYVTVYSDKFNDGLNVEHRFSNKDNDLMVGDRLSVIRSTIDSRVYKYWSEYQSTSLASSAPANPSSNISNGALGYFSVRNSKEYTFEVPVILE